MNQKVYFFDMFSDYEPPETLKSVLSQAAIAAADIDPATRRISVAVESEEYIPGRLLDQAVREIRALYGLNTLELNAVHPESELHKIEPEELRDLFVSRNSMTRGSLAGALWVWEGTELTVKLTGNGRKELEELILYWGLEKEYQFLIDKGYWLPVYKEVQRLACRDCPL